MVIYMYIAPGQGQTTPWAQNIFISINPLSICSFLASFLTLNDIFLSRVMIYTNFVELHCLMLHAKFQNHRPSGSGVEDF